jgi:hypothetical protein
MVLSYPIVSQLQSHLYIGIWTNATVLHETFAIWSVHVNSQVHIIQQV